ncbi:MAG TPA: ExeM/NucH family extracellular endonuclease [Nocardioides sp.]|nr:ExeM/NucH family extracellular endonuclease [Nocardioides sp.]
MRLSARNIAVFLAPVLSIAGVVALAPTASANAAGTGLVINEVYGGGGNASAPYLNDFVELYNPTDAAVSLSGTSLQYRAAATTSAATNVYAFGAGAKVAAHDSFLVQCAGGTTSGVALPLPADATNCAINLSGTAGQVYLVNDTSGIAAQTNAAAPWTFDSRVIDFVGFGTASIYEGAGKAPAPSNTTSISRNGSHADTDANNADFSAGAPSPQNSALAAADPGTQTFQVGSAITPFKVAATGGKTPYTYSASGLPDGLTLDSSTGQVSGTPTSVGDGSVTVQVSDAASATAGTIFTISITAAPPLAVAPIADQSVSTTGPIAPITPTVSGGVAPYSFSTSSTLPGGLSLDPATGAVSGTPTGPSGAFPITIDVSDAQTPPATTSVSYTISVSQVQSIADLQGTGARSAYAPATGTGQGAQAVTTQGIVTAIFAKGYASSGNASCGLCGFYLQTAGTGGATDATPGASDAIFVYGFSSFAGKDSAGTTLSVGDSVRVTGKVSEFNSDSTATETLTELNATGTISRLDTSLGTITPQTTLPTTYADREAHEGEAFAPTDVVVDDTYNFEGDGELGLATGDKPLVQPTEICADDDTACLATADQDIVDRGWFLGAGTSTAYTTSSSHYAPYKSKNSDIPLPFMDATHSARVGAKVTAPDGKWFVLDFRHDMAASSSSSGGSKWYLEPQRSVSASCGSVAPHTTTCSTDLGDDVVAFEDTRTTNQHPADVGGNLKIATFNVENYFTETGKAFAAANPYIGDSPLGVTSDSTKGCQYDYDRQENPVLTYQCVSDQAVPDQWDPVTGAPTHYTTGLVNAPRGAATQADQDRQTAKIVTAIKGLGADVVSLEEIANPNKLKEGITNAPLNPDVTNTKDQGLGTAIAWRDQTLAYLVSRLNEADGDQWAFVASPEESTDATTVTGLCSKVRADGSPVPGPASTAGTCSYASMQDVIRSAFIYKRTKVVPVGPSDIDFPGYTVNGTPDAWGNHSFAPGASPFDNAREPLAQYFKPVGRPNSDGFAVVVNHFKSKGNDSSSGVSTAPTVNGQPNDNYSDPKVGANNAARTRQALEAMRFANAFAQKWGTDKVFMVGDFNSYTKEDPVQAILDSPDNQVGNGGLGFSLLESNDPKDLTYVFSTSETVGGRAVGYGAAGSIDHIFVSAGAKAQVTGTDVWEINANETDAYDYARYNSNATPMFDGSQPFRSSDHNPEIIGFNVGDTTPTVTDVQVLGMNDFHGRLIGDASDGGAAQMAGAVKSLRSTYGADRTVLASAGDNVGASIFESFTQKDKPTLDALNAMDLQVSSVGNHEFDHGVGDLLGRIEQPYDATTNKYGADQPLTWGDYLAANVVWSAGPHAGEPITAPTKEVMVDNPLNPGHPIKIGFVGTVTSDLPSLQRPANLDGVTVLDTAATVAKVNDYAQQLKANGDQLVILLTHEGAATTDCSTMQGAGTAFSTIVNGVSPDVDAVLSGHTHLEYSCQFPVAEWAGRAITARPVMQAASYGTALDQLVYSFDATDTPVALVQNNVGVKGSGGTLFSYPQDPTVKPIVDQAIADSATAGAQVLGKMSAPLYRSKLSDGTDNRGGESVLGNQIAEIQRWATADQQHGGAQIAFMNPGGLRADALGNPDNGAYDLTYRQAADVQPFANELVNLRLTGAQIKKVLEEQWQRDANGNIPARPFLKLGISKGFSYTYTEAQDPAKPAGAMLGTVTGMWLDGQPIDPASTYSVTVNSFLSTGGDNFWELGNGTDKQDTELTDLQAQVDYMEQQYATTPLPVDSSQRGIRVTFPDGAPADYAPGDTVTLDLASLDLNAPSAVQDDTVSIEIGGDVVAADIPVTHGNSTTPDDHWGTAHVSFVVPADVTSTARVHVVGAATGTDVTLPVRLRVPPLTTATPTIDDTTPRAGDTLTATPGTWGPGTVALSYQWLADGTPIAGATGATLVLGTDQIGARITVAITGIEPGYETATVTSAETDPVGRALVTVTGGDVSQEAGQTATLQVTVAGTPALGTPTGTVTLSSGGVQLGSATLGAGGTADVTLAAGALPASPTAYDVTIGYAGDGVYQDGTGHASLTVTATPPSQQTPTVTGTPTTQRYGRTASMKVTVAAGGVIPTGTVALSSGGVQLGQGTLGANGTVVVTIAAKALKPRATPYPVTIAYSGDASVLPGTGTAQLSVTKGSVRVSARASTTHVVVKRTRLGITVRVVNADGVLATGRVAVSGPGTTRVTGTLSSGRVTLRLRPFATTGRKRLTVTYAGSGYLLGGRTTLSVLVVRK